MVVIKIRIKGIENAIDYKDSGIFSDRNKTETNNTDYLVAGQAVDNMMVLEKQEKYSLSPKFAISGLQSIGNLISYDTSTGVAKHTDGTVIFKDATHIDGDFPDRRLSLMFGVENGELLYKNNPDDPMPIKTINMNGLQKWEETDDYIIYLDKDAVMTTVNQYVTGTYDLFKERKADVDRSMELLKMNDIEWTSKDDSKLILDINKAQLERIANTPTTMEEEDFAPQTFTTRAVPTTYECCFRVDKKSGDIYIGEGYENFVLNEKQNAINYSHAINTSNVLTSKTLIKGIYSATIILDKGTGNLRYLTTRFNESGKWSSEKFYSYEDLTFDESDYVGVTHAFSFHSNTGIVYSYKHLQITKTSTPKPFVKSIMPSGKLSFVTGATSETHSFVMRTLGNPENIIKDDLKNVKTLLRIGTPIANWPLGTRSDCDFDTKEQRDEWLNGGDLLLSNTTNKTVYKGRLGRSRFVGTGSDSENGEITISTGRYNTHTPTTFKQLLIYKGNLTEAELKAENEKDINDFSWYYWDKSSVISNYLINGFSQCLVYSPALTDAEITEEIAKSIKLPETMAIGLK